MWLFKGIARKLIWLNQEANRRVIIKVKNELGKRLCRILQMGGKGLDFYSKNKRKLLKVF